MSNQDFHEVWWIASPDRHPWGGVRLAHFRKTMDGALIVYITGETDPKRVGVRIWEDIEPREGWVKVKQIPIPTQAEIDAAMETKMREIAQMITKEAGF